MSKNEPSGEALLTVARAVRTRGLKGEVVAELLTDFPERFDHLEQIFVIGPAGERTVAQLEQHWFQGNRVILKVAGYDDPQTSSALVGCEFAIRESDRVSLPADHYYDWELE